MYDTRTEKEVLTVNHGSPIESLLFLPSGGIFLSAGGTDIKIWDTIAGGKLLGSISQHHKTITCLKLASDNKRLLSSSLDRHVKIYDVSTFKVVHTLDYPNSVLSLGVSKNDDTVVAGLVDGLVSISRREEEPDKVPEKKISSYKYASRNHPVTVDTIVPELKHEKQTHHDECLRKFEYSKALTCVLRPYVANKTPQITVSVMQELLRRKALSRALQARDPKSLLQFLRFLLKNIPDVRFTRILIDVANTFLDVYENKAGTLPADVLKMIVMLNNLLKQELNLINNLTGLEGAMHMLLAAQSASEQINEEMLKPQKIIPSANAQKNLVVTLS